MQRLIEGGPKLAAEFQAYASKYFAENPDAPGQDTEYVPIMTDEAYEAMMAKIGVDPYVNGN